MVILMIKLIIKMVVQVTHVVSCILQQASSTTFFCSHHGFKRSWKESSGVRAGFRICQHHIEYAPSTAFLLGGLFQACQKGHLLLRNRNFAVLVFLSRFYAGISLFGKVLAKWPNWVKSSDFPGSSSLVDHHDFNFLLFYAIVAIKIASVICIECSFYVKL